MNQRGLLYAGTSQTLAIITHGYLALQHYSVRFGEGVGESVCNINDTFNCDLVNLSAYSKLFGVPMALLGVLFNIFLLFLVNLATSGPRKSHFLKLAQIAAIFSVGVSLVMGYISTVKLQTFCLFCIATYLFSFITLVVLFKVFPQQGRPGLSQLLGSVKEANFRIGKVLLSGFALMTAGAFLVDDIVKTNSVSNHGVVAESAYNEWVATPKKAFDYSKGLHKGADLSTAKMILVEFADFECPHCKTTSPVLQNFVSSNAQEVALIFYNFPLDGCKKEYDNAQRCELAKAVYCAEKEGKGWAVHDWIFDNFREFKLTELQSAVEAMGVNGDSFRECRDNPSSREAILEQIEIGKEAGVKGTPSIFINGKKVSYGNKYFVLESILNKL